MGICRVYGAGVIVRKGNRDGSRVMMELGIGLAEFSTLIYGRPICSGSSFRDWGFGSLALPGYSV